MFSEIANLISPLDYEKTKDRNAILPTSAIALDEIKAWIDQLLDLNDIDLTKKENLVLISKLLNYPFTKEDDPNIQRRFLKSAIDFYKSKGTLECFKILFYNIGYEVEVIPLWTADITITRTVTIPYIRVIGLINNIPGIYNVQVTNPDGQFDIQINGYTYVEEVEQ